MNITIFSGSGPADNNEVDQAVSDVPEYASYTMLFIMSMSIPVVIVPALSAIVIIVKNKKLQTNNNIFLINLLLTDVGIALACCTNGLLTTLYLLGVDVGVDCTLLVTSLMILVIANKLMFIPMCVDRFIHIAFPFSYKRIVTTKVIMITIITLWMVSTVILISLYINVPLHYMPSLGVCRSTQVNLPGLLIIIVFLHTYCSDYYNKYILAPEDHQVK